MSIFEGDIARGIRAERVGTGFRMETNIKARPGSQGTLFQGGKPVAEHRWPRGYSPHRMASTSYAVGLGGLHVSATPEADYSGADPLVTHPHLNPSSGRHTQRLMLEPIARSTVPAERLATLRGLRLHMDPKSKPGDYAEYSPVNQNILVHRQPMLSTEDPRERIAKADATLIHEIGHHLDISGRQHEVAAQAAAHPAGFDGLRGPLEQAADKNMIEHFRNDPRNQRRTGFNVRKETYGGRGVGGLHQDCVDPGAETGAETRARLFARKIAHHKAKTGEVASESPLHPGQFDRQQVLF